MKRLRPSVEYPPDGAEVLIRYNGIIELARYAQSDKSFRVKNGNTVLYNDQIVYLRSVFIPEKKNI
jgi:hypothetical protein